MDIEAKVRQYVIDTLDVNPEEVVPQAKFIDDLGADSLDIVEMIMALEEEFDVEISDEEAEKLATVGDAVEFIKSKASN